MAVNTKRFGRRFKFTNNTKRYEDILYRKGVKQINQYSTPTILKPTAQQRKAISEVSHVWKTGDRYYKLAEKYYGRPRYWWAIALYNNKPTEGHVRKGDVIKIPLPLETYLRYL